MIESLVAATLLLAAAIALVPLVSQLAAEQKALGEKREMANELHDRLQPFLWNSAPDLPQTIYDEGGLPHARFTFKMHSDLIEGCVYWKNAMQREEMFCLYGKPSP